MNLESIKALATAKTARQLLLLQKHSPKILFVAGTVGVVGTVVLACRATLKLDPILQMADDQKSEASEAFMVDAMTETDYKRRVRTINLAAGLSVAKAYGPATGLGVASILLLTGSHVILTKRNAAISAAFAGSQKFIDTYRDRVRNELGEEREAELAYGVVELEVTEKMADGSEDVTTKKHIGQHFGMSQYAVMFDARSHHFTKEPGMNRHTLSSIQAHMNDKLRANGHLFLNEVYDSLGLDRTTAGSLVGWVWDPRGEKFPGTKRDNEVSFGIFTNPDKEWVNNFMDGREQEILLDFNVDGEIYRLI